MVGWREVGAGSTTSLTQGALPCRAACLYPSPAANPHEHTACEPAPLQVLISDMCSRLDVDGLRGDIVINRAAKALVAYEGRSEVTLKDVERIIPSCLNHR